MTQARAYLIQTWARQRLHRLLSFQKLPRSCFRFKLVRPNVCLSFTHSRHCSPKHASSAFRHIQGSLHCYSTTKHAPCINLSYPCVHQLCSLSLGSHQRSALLPKPQTGLSLFHYSPQFFVLSRLNF